MSEEEFLNRLLNKIAKNFSYDEASTLELMFIKKEKQVEQLENIRKEATEECKSVIGNPEHTIVSKNELMKLMLNTLNKGE